MLDSYDDNSLTVTSLDLERLKELDINGRVDGECGFWVVFRNKNDYLLTIDQGKRHEILEFKHLGEVIGYLKEF
jgi:hypothetical protein